MKPLAPVRGLKKHRIYDRFNQISLGLSLVLASVLSPLASLANPTFPLSASAQSVIANAIAAQEAFDPPGDDAPPDTVGAGTRSDQRCPGDVQALRPLMSSRNYGLTFAEHPTLFVQVPATSAKQVVLTFQDEARTFYQRTFLPIQTHAGVAQFQLPTTQTPLTVGKNYRWSLVVVCGEHVQPDDPVFMGWVQRVEPRGEGDRLTQKSPLQQAQWYAERGYWYDMLTVLNTLRPTYPEIWQNLLDQLQIGHSQPG
ncbi:MAG: DUF928 domain-containing protein [Oculatellaceae cyanobacterium Prado106]|jgi:hypothetical protein|nr:DUF928 domain-containing protein [Oculatellaceae cyanobacterium Prado106]